MNKKKNLRKLKAEIRAIEAVHNLGEAYILTMPLSYNNEVLVDDVRDFRDSFDLNSRDGKYKYELSFQLDVNGKIYKVLSLAETLD